MQRALAGHAAASVHAAACLVDIHLVGIEALLLLLAFQGVLAFDGGHLQLGQQVVADRFAGIRLQIGQDLQRNLGFGATRHEAAVEVGLLAGIQRQQTGPALDRFGVVNANDCASHVLLLKVLT